MGKESASRYDDEMRRCEDILKLLNINSDITTNVTKDFRELDELKADMKELKDLIFQLKLSRPEPNIEQETQEDEPKQEI